MATEERAGGRLRSGVVGGSIVAIALGLSGALNYLLSLLAAHRLGPAEFGQFSAVLALIIVLNVVGLGLQATAARRVAASGGLRLGVERGLLRATWQAALAVLVVMTLLTPVLGSALRLTTWWSALMLAASGALLALMGGLVGLLQGEERWGAVSAAYVAMGVGRLGCGAVALFLQPTAASVLTGVAVGSLVPVASAWWSLRRGHGAGELGVSAADGGVGLWREVGHSAHALGVFFALANVDILVARVGLAEHDAGLYASGLIVAKALLFLPQFVVVVTFPIMARAGSGEGAGVAGAQRAARVGLAVIALMGAVVTAVVAFLPRFALAFAGGAAYAEVRPWLWVFAALGSVLAMVQFLVYGALARADRYAVAVLWLGLAAVVGLGWFAGAVGTLAVRVLIVDAVVMVALGWGLLRGGRAERHTDFTSDGSRR